MKITIDVPGMKCAKCDAEAPLQPVFLYAKGVVPPQFREALNDVVKEHADVLAIDNGGRSWGVFADDKPAGWTKGPAQSDLCPTCTALWAEAGKEFLAPPVELPVVEAAPLPSPPVRDQPARPQTMSEMLASRIHAHNMPVANSMIPSGPLKR